MASLVLGLLLGLFPPSMGASGQEGPPRPLREEPFRPIASRGRHQRRLVQDGLLWHVRSHAVERGLEVGLVIDVTVENRSRRPRLLDRRLLNLMGEHGVVERGRFLAAGGMWGEGVLGGPDCASHVARLPLGASLVLRREWPARRGLNRGLMRGEALRVTVTANPICGGAPGGVLALGVITLLVPPATGEPPTVSVGR